MTASFLGWSLSALTNAALLTMGASSALLVLGHGARRVRNFRVRKSLALARAEVGRLVMGETSDTDRVRINGTIRRRDLEEVLVGMALKVDGATRGRLAQIAVTHGFVERSVYHLDSPRKKTRGRAIRLLEVGFGSGGDESTARDRVPVNVAVQAVSGLTASLRDKSPEIRAGAALVLGAIGQQASVTSIVHAVEDAPSIPSPVALRAIERVGSSSIPTLLKLSSSEGESTRTLALRALGVVGDFTIVRFLEEFVDDQHPTAIRLSAIDSLARIGDPRAGLAICAALRDDDPTSIRRAAITALGKLAHPGSVEVLVAAARDEDHETARSAARALAALWPAIAQNVSDERGETTSLVAFELARFAAGSAELTPSEMAR
jgi:HEAT repeat protein